MECQQKANCTTKKWLENVLRRREDRWMSQKLGYLVVFSEDGLTTCACDGKYSRLGADALTATTHIQLEVL